MLTKATLCVALLIAVTIQPTAIEPEVRIITKAMLPDTPQSNRKLAQQLAQVGFGWTGREWGCLDRIISNESHYNERANNKRSTAYGVMQMLGETSKEPTIQLLRGYRYLQHRYETPCKAWKFHAKHRYY